MLCKYLSVKLNGLAITLQRLFDVRANHYDDMCLINMLFRSVRIIPVIDSADPENSIKSKTKNLFSLQFLHTGLSFHFFVNWMTP